MVGDKGQGIIIHPTIPGTVVDPSVFVPYPLDEFQVGFKKGTSFSTVMSVHAGMGATILTWYPDIEYTFVKVPPSKTVIDVFSYYLGQDSVLYVFPNAALVPQRNTNDTIQPTAFNFNLTNTYGSWDVVAPDPTLGGCMACAASACPANTRPGSPKILVAIADTGVKLNHPDLWKNIYINQKEMFGAFPPGQGPHDTNGDQIVTFEELNSDPLNKPICDAIKGNDGDPTATTIAMGCAMISSAGISSPKITCQTTLTATAPR